MTLEILTRNADLALIAPKILYGVASPQEVQAIKSADFLAIRTDPSAVHVRSTVAEVERVEKDGSLGRTRRFIASDETPDRYGDVIKVDGWDFKNFQANPVALWAHDDGAPPIGTVTEMSKTAVGGRRALKESISYFEASVNPMSEMILRLVDAGGVRAVSVGFIPKSHKRAEQMTKEEADSYGLGKYGVLFEAVEQVELSNCSIPANPNALISKTLVPMVREMEAGGEIPASMARDFYRAVTKLETERRVFSLGAPAGEGVKAASTSAAKQPAAPPASDKAMDVAISDNETPAEDATETPADEAAEDAAEEAADEARFAALETRVTKLEGDVATLASANKQLAAEHEATRGHLAAAVKTISALVKALDEEPSGSDRHTSGGEPTKPAAAPARKHESYLVQTLADTFRENLNR